MWRPQEEATFLLRFSEPKKLLHFICSPSCSAHGSAQEGHQHLHNCEEPEFSISCEAQNNPEMFQKHLNGIQEKPLMTVLTLSQFLRKAKDMSWAITRNAYLSMYSNELEEHSSKSKNTSGLSAVCLTDSTAKTNLLTCFCSFNWNCKYQEFIGNALIDMKNLASIFWNVSQDT